MRVAVRERLQRHAPVPNERLQPGNPEGYPDIYIAMGQTAENVAAREEISREEMDRFALRSQQRAVAAQDDGFFDREIVPVDAARRRRDGHQG